VKLFMAINRFPSHGSKPLKRFRHRRVAFLPRSDGHGQFILATWGLPERQKGNSLGQRPRKGQPHPFQPEGLAQLSHTFSVLASERASSWGVAPGYFPAAHQAALLLLDSK